MPQSGFRIGDGDDHVVATVSTSFKCAPGKTKHSSGICLVCKNKGIEAARDKGGPTAVGRERRVGEREIGRWARSPPPRMKRGRYRRSFLAAMRV